MPHLGLGYLASTIRKNGYEVDIIDCEALRLNTEGACRKILNESPDYVAITAVTLSIGNAADLAMTLKEFRPELKILIGGPHITATPYETMRRFSQFDLGVIGEGEITVVELLKALDSSEDIDTVDGLIYRKNGNILKTGDRSLIRDLDTIPFPAWDLYPDLRTEYRPSAFGFKKLPSTSLITSRGCPGSCSFCNQGPWGRLYREHSEGYVMEMVRILYHRYKIRDLAIYDGTFGVTKDRLIRLCNLLIKEKMDLVWSCNLRINMANVEMLRLMKKAGCWGIAYGIESGSQKILDFIKKGITKEQISEAIQNTKKAGIISKGYMMVGMPLETKETLNETLNFVLDLDLDLLTVNHFTPFPGTLDYERVDRFGLFDKSWNLLNEHSLVFVPESLSKKDIESYITRITRKFYFRPRVIFNFAGLALKPENLKVLYIGFLAFLKFLLRKEKKRNNPIILKIPRGKVYFSKKAFIRGFTSILKGRILSGSSIDEFERRFADYIGIRHAISTYSGTLSLCLCLEALNIEEGDEIILPAYMVQEVVEVIKGYRAVPVFVDIDPATHNMDPELIEGKIGKRTKLIIMAHMYGCPSNIDRILDAAKRYNLKVIEDCAQACGAEYNNKKVGSFGDIAYFSFGVMKNMNTLGGGMITTDNNEVAYKIRKRMEVFALPKKAELIRKYFVVSLMALATTRVVFTIFIYPIMRLLNLISKNYLYNSLRGNKKTDTDMKGISLQKYRIRYANLQAVIGLEQLKTLDRNNRIRVKNALFLNKALRSRGVTLPLVNPGAKNIYLNYAVQLSDREKLMEALFKKGIDTTNGYMEFFLEDSFSELLVKNNLYLPIQYPLHKKIVSIIADTLNETKNTTNK
ncbi:MAG: DegT/DnrJ/EryC1/StrS family aminotransferase [Planctomycetota bacterium]